VAIAAPLVIQKPPLQGALPIEEVKYRRPAAAGTVASAPA
jgi:hypothetical protein